MFVRRLLIILTKTVIMKKALLLLMILPMIGFGQTWKYSSDRNDFDGQYKTASVKGSGSDYAYNAPSLVINSFETSGINFYISDAGQYLYGSNTEILLSFNNEKGNVYSATDISWAGDNVFMGDIYTVTRDGIAEEESLTRLQIFKKLMTASYLNISIRNNYEQNDMKFSLSRSTNAIKYVIPDFDQLMIDEEKIKEEDEEGGWNKYIRSNDHSVLKTIFNDDNDYFITVDNMPEFPGGDKGLIEYINKKIKYPSSAKKQNITGKVYVSFIVEKSGYVTNVKVVKGVDKKLDNEAVRVIRSLPKYKPGTKRGEKVRVLFTIPINFTLSKPPFEHTF